MKKSSVKKPWEEYTVAETSGEMAPWEEYASQPEPMSTGQSARIKTEEGLTFGARPFVAGVGGAIGGGLAKLTSPREMGLLQRLEEAKTAAGEGFSEERALAQQEQAQAEEQLGPVASGAIGLGTGLLTAPLTPVRGLKGAMALGGAMGAGQALGQADDLKQAGLMIGTGAATGGAVQKIAPIAGKYIAKGAKKVASALTGISEKEIETYATRADKVNKLIKETGGEPGNISLKADEVRQKLQEDIVKKRVELGTKIGDTLAKSSPEKNIPISPYLEKLESYKGKINSKHYLAKASELDDIISRARSLADESGNISGKELHELKEFLQDQAKPSYLKNGQIFSRGKEAQKAAKFVARDVNQDVQKLFPEIADANKQLFRLHRIEDGVNKNLIAPGKPEGALLSAGRGENARNVKYLQELGKLTGKDVLSEAETLAAAKTFGSPPLLPVDSTGKSLTRMAVAGGAGLLGGGPLGAGIAAAATSPMALKAAINAGRIPQAIIQKLGGDKAVNRLLTSEKGRSLLIQQIAPYLSNKTGGLLQGDQ